jgi:hypothetical protein
VCCDQRGIDISGVDTPRVPDAHVIGFSQSSSPVELPTTAAVRHARYGVFDGGTTRTFGSSCAVVDATAVGRTHSGAETPALPIVATRRLDVGTAPPSVETGASVYVTNNVEESSAATPGRSPSAPGR